MGTPIAPTGIEFGDGSRLLLDESVLRDVELRVWQIAVAWEETLAGDIEDLIEDLALEERARFPGSGAP